MKLTKKSKVPVQMQKLLETKWACVDFETTSKYPQTALPVSVAIVRCDGLRFYSPINPEQPIPLEASKIHGIYDKDVQNAPTFADLHPLLNSMIYALNFVAFNASYDYGVLSATCKRHDLPMIEIQKAYCAMKMANQYIIDNGGMRKWPRLAEAAKFLEIETGQDGFHNALYDVQMTIKIMRAIASKSE